MQPVTLKNLRESNGYRTMWAPITVFDKNKKQKCQGIIITENQICIINIDNQKPKYILGTSTDKDVEKFIQDNSLWHEVIRWPFQIVKKIEEYDGYRFLWNEESLWRINLNLE